MSKLFKPRTYLKYKMRPVGDGYFVIKNNLNRSLTINDVHPGYGATIIRPVKMKKRSAEKTIRFLNHFYNGYKRTLDWKVFYRMKRKMEIDYCYY